MRTYIYRKLIIGIHKSKLIFGVFDSLGPLCAFPRGWAIYLGPYMNNFGTFAHKYHCTITYAGVAQGPGNLEKVPEEILALFPGDSRSFFPEKPIKFQN